MNPFLAILRAQFPTVYPEGAPECGYTIGPGWFPLVFEASRRIHELNLRHPETPTISSQIKEKFGGLRFYIEGRWEDTRPPDVCRAASDIEGAAENASWKVCEDCGLPGSRRGGGWIRTLCNTCAQTWAHRNCRIVTK